MTIYHSQSGLTLIELMIAIAIVGILSAIAIPQYQIYVAKTQAMAVIADIGQLRLPIEECFQTGKTMIGFDTNECDPRTTAGNLILDASLAGATLSNEMAVLEVSNPLTVTTSIIATLTTKGSPGLAGKKILWARSSDGTWRCSSSIDAIYLPNYCTHVAAL